MNDDLFLSLYLDGELADTPRTTFQEHMHDCPSCEVFLDTYKQAVELGKTVFDDLDASVPADVPEALVDAILAARRAEG